MHFKFHVYLMLGLFIGLGSVIYTGCSEEGNPTEPEKTTGTLKTVIKTKPLTLR